MMKYILIGCLPVMALLSGCSPEVGSSAWCNQMDQKSKGDWSAHDATEYAQHCIFRKTEK